MIPLRSALGAAILVVFLSSCHSKTAEDTRALPVVRAESVNSTQATLGNRYSGVVRANKQVELDFKLAGYIKSLGKPRGVSTRSLQEGDYVTVGTTLAVLDAADYVAKVESAKAALLEAQAAAQQARRDFTRAQSLVTSGAATPVELENRSSTVDVYSARVARATAAVHEASLALKDTSLRAPFSGVIISKLVEQGAFVTARTPGFVLADNSVMKVVFGVPDSVVGSLQVGEPATVELPSLGQRIAAQISRISPAADAKSRVFEVEVMLPNSGDEVRVGLAATVSLDSSDKLTAGILVPLRALLRGKGQTDTIAVYVIESQGTTVKARQRDVKLLQVVGDSAVITGLSPTDRVITVGAALLHDGDAVRLLP